MPSSHRVKQLIIPIVLTLISTPLWSSMPANNAAVSWAGPYVGGFTGGAFGHYQLKTSTGFPAETAYFASAANFSAVNHSGTTSSSPEAFLLGIKAGDDWVWQQVVLGAVVDYSSFKQESDIRVAAAAYPDGSGNYSLSSTLTTDWLLTLRGRAGVQCETLWPSLLYTTAGLAITKVSVVTTFNDNTLLLGQGTSRNSANQMGWTLGGGIDMAVNSHFSINAEYLHVHVPALTSSGTIDNSAEGFGIAAGAFSSPFLNRVNFSSDLIRIGVNGRFNV